MMNSLQTSQMPKANCRNKNSLIDLKLAGRDSSESLIMPHAQQNKTEDAMTVIESDETRLWMQYGVDDLNQHGR